MESEGFIGCGGRFSEQTYFFESDLRHMNLESKQGLK